MSTAINDRDGADSTFGDGPSAAVSITTTIINYEWKHGRRYHAYNSGAYCFPNDDREQNRLDMLHHTYCLSLEGRLFLAPVNPRKVLDIGTGTGIWAIEVADQHPGASVTGIDLSPIQPDFIPPNLEFIVDDMEQDWVEPTRYDFIHCRYMAGSIKNWPRLVQQIFDNLEPGGWVEFQETDNTIYSKDDTLQSQNFLVQLMDGLRRACDLNGRTLDPARSFTKWAEEAGFAGIKEQRFGLPVGGWLEDESLKDIGNFLAASFYWGVGALTAVLFTEVLGWGREEVEVLNAGVRGACRRTDSHLMFDFVVVIAQKPE